MIKKFVLLFVCSFFFFFQPGFAQKDSVFHFIRQFNYPVSSFAVDNIGAVYIINTNNQLKKYNENGDSVGVFNQVTQFGKLSYVDAENPWKTILFYQNFSTIVLLDKYLNLVTSINLREKNIFQVHAVTSSYDNKIWLYDEQDNKLKKIDDNGNLLSESVDFRLLFDSVPEPDKIIDTDGFVYLYDPQNGLYVFDYYGSFKTKLAFLNWKNIEVFGKTIFGFDNQNVYKYNPPLPDITAYHLPEELQNATAVKTVNHRIYILKDEKLSVYSLP